MDLQFGNDTLEPGTFGVLGKDGEIIYTVISSTIMIIGIFLNFLVILAYLTKRMEQSLFNFCLFNLSIVNISQCIGFSPYVAFHIWKDEIDWPQGLAGKVICGFTEGITVFFISAFVNAFSIAYISVLRYRMIVRVERFTAIPRSTRVTFIVFWIGSAVLMLPNFLRMNYSTKVRLCIRTFDILSETVLMCWGFLNYLFIFMMPLFVIAFSHFRITLDMCKSKNTQFKSQVKKRHRSKVVICLGIVVVIFVVCWTPWSVYWAFSALGYFGADLKAQYATTRIIKWVMLPCVCASVLNVISFVVVNKRIRNSVLSVLTMKKKFRYTEKSMPTTTTKQDSTEM